MIQQQPVIMKSRSPSLAEDGEQSDSNTHTHAHTQRQTEVANLWTPEGDLCVCA